MPPKLKPKKCRVCKEPFTPRNSMQVVCNPRCAAQYVVQCKEKKQKAKETAQRRADRKWKRENRPLREVVKDAQKAFNEFVRVRDRYKECISCGAHEYSTSITGSNFDAGHYRSVGAAPHLRFYLFNCAKQCTRCNKELSGNTVEMRKGLILRWGEEMVERVEHYNTPRQYSKDQLTRIARIFRKRAKLYRRLRESRC